MAKEKGMPNRARKNPTGKRGMSRKTFVKSVGLSAAGVGAAAVSGSGVAHATPVDGVWELYPSTNPNPYERHVENAELIQDAVDNANDGDSILLKAGEWYLSPAVPSQYGFYGDPTGYDVLGFLFELDYINIGSDEYPALVPLHVSWIYDFVNDMPAFTVEQTVYIIPGINNWEKLTIKGEKDPKGNHLTKIIGGYSTLGVGLVKGSSSKLDLNEPYFPPLRVSSFFLDVLAFGGPWDGVRFDNLDLKLDVSIEDLEFVNPLMTAIGCSSCTGLKIKGNKFTGCRGFPYVFIPYHDHVAYPIRIGAPGTFQQANPPDPEADPPFYPIPVDPSIVTGDIVIEGNEWDGKATAYCEGEYNPWASIWIEGWDDDGFPLIAPCTHVGADFADRIMYTRANVSILNNRAVGTVFGFSIESNMFTEQGEYGNNIVKGNYVKHKPLGAYPGEDTNGAQGIWVEDGNWSRYGNGGQYPGNGEEPSDYRYGVSRTLIEGNELINSGGISWFPELVVNGLDNAIMRRNRISVAKYRQIVMGVFGCNGCVIQGNRLSGEAAAGIWITFAANGNPIPPAYDDITLKDSENNLFQGNNLSNLSILEGPYFIPDPAFDLPGLRYSYYFLGAGEADLSGLGIPEDHGIMTEGSNNNVVRGNSKDKVADLTGTNHVTGTGPMAGAPKQGAIMRGNAARILGHGPVGNAVRYFQLNKESLLANAKQSIREQKP